MVSLARGFCLEHRGSHYRYSSAEQERVLEVGLMVLLWHMSHRTLKLISDRLTKIVFHV